MLGRYRAVDLTGELGWLAGRLLADLGMDVVKLEPPSTAIDGIDWRAFNVNKRVARLDVHAPHGRALLERLLAHADVLIETEPPMASSPLLDSERLHVRSPRLVHVSITPFGRTGPRASWRASDIEIMASAGAMSLAGETDGKPMRISVPQARGWAGTHAASGALVALLHRSISGCGQHVDVSAQAAVLAALAHAPVFVDITGSVPTRCGSYITGRTVSGARFRAFWPCADGYLNFVLYGGPAGRRSNEQLVAWMRERGADPGPLGAIDIAKFDPKLLSQDEIDRLEAPVARVFARLTKREFLDGASAREMLGYPVSTIADIASDPQLEARSFFADVRARDGSVERHCGAFPIIDGTRAPLRHPPGEGVTIDELLAQWSNIDQRVAEPAL